MFRVWYPAPLENQLKPLNQKVFPETLTILVHSNLLVKTPAKLREDPGPKKSFKTSLFPAKPKEEKREEDLQEVTEKNQITEAPAVGNINRQASPGALRSL